MNIHHLLCIGLFDFDTLALKLNDIPGSHLKPLAQIYLAIVLDQARRNSSLRTASVLYPIQHFEQLDQLDMVALNRVFDHLANLPNASGFAKCIYSFSIRQKCAGLSFNLGYRHLGLRPIPLLSNYEFEAFYAIFVAKINFD
jgi:hypothetical protein